MPQARTPLVACTLLGAALAALGLGTMGCKSKPTEPPSSASAAGEGGASQAQDSAVMTVLGEALSDDSERRLESGVLSLELDRHAGEMDDRNRYAATVMITTGAPMDSVECSGVLVSPRLVLTAGSCLCTPRAVSTPVTGEKTVIDGSACAKRVTVTTARYGEVLDRNFKEVTTQVEFQSHEGEVRPHPELQLRLDERGAVISGRADLAAILLDRPVEQELAGVPLADSEVQSGEWLTMVGYARDSQQRLGGFLGVRYFRRNKVQGGSPDGRVRYEQQGPFLYNGYMGGPCLREKGNERSLVGVASVDSDEQVSFTSTYVFRDWLSAELRHAARRGAAAPGLD